MRLILSAPSEAVRAPRAAAFPLAVCLIAACAADADAMRHDEADAQDTDAPFDAAAVLLDASRDTGTMPPSADAGTTGSTDAGGKGDASIESAIVAPSAGPASCGCAAGHVCVRWAPLDSKIPGGLECWPMAACTAPARLPGTHPTCSCFNPCIVRHVGGGTFCFDRNYGTQIIGAEDLRCVQGQP